VKSVSKKKENQVTSNKKFFTLEEHEKEFKRQEEERKGNFFKRTIYNINGLIFNLKNLPTYTKWKIQRMFRGYSDCDSWNANSFIAENTIKILTVFRNMDRKGVPNSMLPKTDDFEEWTDDAFKEAEKKYNEILDKIIFAFKFVVYSIDWCDEENEYAKEMKFTVKDEVDKTKVYIEARKKYEEGMNLFKEHIFSLWD
jgi:hypothetical protein